MSDALSTVTDARGRKITVRRMNVLDQVRLLRAIGKEQSGNEPYVNIVTMAASVSEIDGVPCPTILNERQIDATIGLIGDDGFAALMVDMRAKITTIEAAADAASTGGADPLVTSA